MKIRSDFVTNSSSSAFVVALKGDLTEKQKEAMIRFVEINFLGMRVPTDEESLQELKDDFLSRSEGKLLTKAVRDGMTPMIGRVAFEGDDFLIGLYQELWDELEKADPGRFVGISTDLDY